MLLLSCFSKTFKRIHLVQNLIFIPALVFGLPFTTSSPKNPGLALGGIQPISSLLPPPPHHNNRRGSHILYSTATPESTASASVLSSSLLLAESTILKQKIMDIVKVEESIDKHNGSSNQESNDYVTLIGPYVAHIHRQQSQKNEDNNGILQEVCTLYPIEDHLQSNDNDQNNKYGIGAQAIQALQQISQNVNDSMDKKESAFIISSRINPEKEEGNSTIQVDIDSDSLKLQEDDTNNNKDLLETLAKLMAQRIILQKSQELPDEETVNVDICNNIANDEGNQKLINRITIHNDIKKYSDDKDKYSMFCAKQFFPSPKPQEFVEMVDFHNDIVVQPIAILPRNLVHKFNILHRGIGMVVCKNIHLSDSSNNPNDAEVYCHRRTDFKRIFPSMYDMFIGGVALANENDYLTAAREVAEELGLKRALEDYDQSPDGLVIDKGSTQDALHGPLFKCIVCTGYNRCIVTMFTYAVDAVTESIKVSAFIHL